MTEDAQKSYFFPRIPLKFVLPENYPDIGTVSNISVAPEITDYRFSREELEIKGSYQVTVSYAKNNSDAKGAHLERRELKYDDFFGPLKLQADGYFGDEEEVRDSANENGGKEVYTVVFSRPFHTFVEIESIGRGRSFRPFLVVDKIDLKSEGGRVFKGELVFELINRNRRNPW